MFRLTQHLSVNNPYNIIKTIHSKLPHLSAVTVSLRINKKNFFSHYTSHKESVQEARKKATERLQQLGADEAYISQFASGSGNSGYGAGSSGYTSGTAGFGAGSSGFSAGLTAPAVEPGLCTVPCDR